MTSLPSSLQPKLASFIFATFKTFRLVCQINFIQFAIIEGELLKLETLPGPFLVDNMKDEASRAYGSFPDRLYIVLDGIIVYQVNI